LKPGAFKRIGQLDFSTCAAPRRDGQRAVRLPHVPHLRSRITQTFSRVTQTSKHHNGQIAQAFISRVTQDLAHLERAVPARRGEDVRVLRRPHGGVHAVRVLRERAHRAWRACNAGSLVVFGVFCVTTVERNRAKKKVANAEVEEVTRRSVFTEVTRDPAAGRAAFGGELCNPHR
jgi:hypothetical protein